MLPCSYSNHNFLLHLRLFDDVNTIYTHKKWEWWWVWKTLEGGMKYIHSHILSDMKTLRYTDVLSQLKPEFESRCRRYM